MLFSYHLLMCHTFLDMLPHTSFFLLFFISFIFLYHELFRGGIVLYKVCKKRLLKDY